MYTKSSLLLGSIALAALTAANPAFADAAPPAGSTQPTETGKSTGVEEIVVTAQRRAENVMSVPLAIQAISGESLKSQGIEQISDLQFTVPGYNVSNSSGYTQIFIRGVGNSIFVGADPSVATFIDDVPRIYGSMVNNLVDVQRVEVLKGAQGGLYGRNATGGVVNIITMQPSTEKPKGEVQITYGEKNTLDFKGYVNVPLGDKIAFSASGERDRHDPYIKNLAPTAPYTAANFPNGSFIGSPAATAAFFNGGQQAPSGVDNQDFWAAEGKLLFKPTDNFKITIAGDVSNKDDSNGNAPDNLTPGFTQAVLGGLFQGIAGITTNFPAGFVQGNTPKFTTAAGFPGFVKLHDYGVSATIVLNLPGVDLTSISAYRNQHTQFFDDLNSSSEASEVVSVNNYKHYYYQELRAVSTSSGPLHLIGGGTYLQSSFEGHTSLNILPPLVMGVPVANSTDKVKNWSVYLQAGYDFTDHVSLTVSGRYIHETNKAFFFAGSFPTDFAAPTGTESKFVPSANLSYKLDGGGNVYMRWARGFKSGGVNPVADYRAFPDPTQGAVFKGETVDTFEAGLKKSLLDNRLQFTGDVFYNNYKNLQVSAHATLAYQQTVILAIANAGSARTYGVEGSLVWKAAPPLTLSINAGVLNAKYKVFQLGVTNPQVLTPFNLNGTQMTNAPKFQLSLGANLDQPIGANWRVVGNALVNHTSSILWGQSGLPGVIPDATDPGYWLANLRLGVKTTNDEYELAVFANNAFNSRYTSYGESGAGQGTQLNWGEPRVIGAEFTAKF